MVLKKNVATACAIKLEKEKRSEVNGTKCGSSRKRKRKRSALK
jgi:hypothetical protein